MSGEIRLCEAQATFCKRKVLIPNLDQNDLGNYNLNDSKIMQILKSSKALCACVLVSTNFKLELHYFYVFMRCLRRNNK